MVENYTQLEIVIKSLQSKCQIKQYIFYTK